MAVSAAAYNARFISNPDVLRWPRIGNETLTEKANHELTSQVSAECTLDVEE